MGKLEKDLANLGFWFILLLCAWKGCSVNRALEEKKLRENRDLMHEVGYIERYNSEIFSERYIPHIAMEKEFNYKKYLNKTKGI